MLKVQEFLRSGKNLKDLEELYAIKVRIHPFFNVVCLNYNQIASNLSEEIAQECRALILDMETWNVLSWPFKKFFNFGEALVPADFDWDKFIGFDKLDGSLIHIWEHPRYGWQIATKSVPDADCQVDGLTITFKNLVHYTLDELQVTWDFLLGFLESGYCYTFELTGPENQIVVEYTERCLTLTGIRCLLTMEETLPSEFLKTRPDFPLPIAKEYHGWNKEFATLQVTTLDPKKNEGYVLLDSKWNRVKIKSEAYCFMSNRRDALSKSPKARLELILSEKEDDILPILPEYVQNRIISLKKNLTTFFDQVLVTYTQIMHIKDQKEFAEEAIKYKYASFLFSLRKEPKTLITLFKETSIARLLTFIDVNEENWTGDN